MDRGIMAWFGLIEARFEGIFLSDSYTDDNGRTIDLSRI